MRLFVTQGIDRTWTSASPQSLLLLLFSCTLLINCIEPIDGMITIAGNGNEYQSIIESSFGSGSSLKYGVQYASRLQYFDAYDYGGDTEIDDDGNDNGGGGEVVRQLNVNLCDDVQEGNLIRANDSSVAILARQGRCGIEHKARIASKLNHDGTNKNPEGAGFVKFLIVYQYDQDDEYYKEQEQERERRRKEHEHGDTPVSSSSSSIHQNEEGDSYNDILEQDRVYLQRLLLKQQHHTEEGAGTSTADDRQHDVIPTTVTTTTTAATPQQSRSRHLSNMYKDWKQRLYNPSSHSQNSSSSISSSTSHIKKQQYQYLYDGDIDVVILYISKLSGLDLISNLHTQTSLTYKHGGTVIYIDSYQGWVPSSGTNPEMTVVDAIVIAAFVFICCLGIFGMCANQMLDVGPPGEGQQGGGGANGGLFRRRGLVVLERGETDEHGNRWGPGRYRHGLRLLNEDEVLSLPEVEFSLERALGGGDSHDGNGDSKGQNEEKDEEGECEEGGDLSSPSSSSPLTTPLLSSTCNHFQDISCTICLEDYCEGEKLRILPCQHAFHQDCIVPWLTDRAPTCPLCKAHLLVSRDGDDYDSDEEDHDEDSSQYDSSSEAAVGDIEEDENEASRTIENEFAAWFYSIFTRVRGRSSDDSNETMSATEVEVADIVEDDPLNDMREPLLQDGGDQIHDHSAEDNV